ncbi:hypothetical protein H2198_002980 [Neophaeococcomyces mojaviensis]|uniref:Uncharacterized protein n=1 Tax=Neophaeococcomyces mojaviensis TaxID=3383035 RepID=A0ACC3ACQ1_9EURO|nr:hypothetical protein H2198_002980 [Knufia sp. JES_112]
MSSFTTHINALTTPGTNGIPAVSVAAVNPTGKTLLQHYAGHTLLASTAAPISERSIFRLSSSTKILTAIAALQCVERGQLILDEPVIRWLPELREKQIITLAPPETKDDDKPKFSFKPATTEITLRMLLTHTSGIGTDILHPLLRAWRASRNEPPQAVAGSALKSWDMPLLFEPGTSWMYSSGYDAVGVLVGRLNDTDLEGYMQRNVFAPLGLKDSTFFIKREGREEMLGRLVDCVTRTKEGVLVPWPSQTGDNPPEAQGSGGLFASVPDFVAMLGDLIKEQPKLLKRETVDLLFSPQLQSKDTVKEAFEQARPLWGAMMGELVQGVEAEFGLGGLLVTSDSQGLGNIKGTLCWAGATGTFWLINRERGVAAVYATQVFPPNDEKGWELMQEFVREVWKVC